MQHSCGFQSTRVPYYTLLPFLYGTPTICRRSFQSLAIPGQIGDAATSSDHSRVSRHAISHGAATSSGTRLSSARLSETGSSRATAHDVEGLNKRRPVNQPRSRQHPGNGRDATTITQQERNAFAQLFDRLDRKRPKEWPASRLLANELEANESDVLGEDDFTDLDKLLSVLSDSERATVDQYPEPLQDMAERAQVAQTKQRRKQNNLEPTSEMDDSISDVAIAEGRWEQRRITVLIEQATTDVAVWLVMENEVFSTMRALEAKRLRDQLETTRLDEEVVQLAPDAGEHQDPVVQGFESFRRRTLEDSLASTQVRAQENLAPVAGPTVTMSIFSHCYPIVTWHALRRLLSRTPASPLVFSLLPTIKSIGRTSLVLAASTPFFNVLLIHTWRTTGSLARVLALLREMDGAGVAMNEATWHVLNEVAKNRRQGQQGDLGPALAGLEGLSVRRAEGDEIQKWRQRIRQGIEQRVLDAARRKEEQHLLEDDEINFVGGAGSP